MTLEYHYKYRVASKYPTVGCLNVNEERLNRPRRDPRLLLDQHDLILPRGIYEIIILKEILALHYNTVYQN